MVHVPCYLHQCQNVWIFTAGPDRCPNGLPMYSADDKSHRERQSDQRLVIHISVKLWTDKTSILIGVQTACQG